MTARRHRPVRECLLRPDAHLLSLDEPPSGAGL